MQVPVAFLTGAPGPLEVLVIAVVILVLFGPKRLPEVARQIGRVIHQLRRAADDVRDAVMKESSGDDAEDRSRDHDGES